MLAVEPYQEQPCTVQHFEEWKRELVERFSSLEEVTFACPCGGTQTIQDVIQAGLPEHCVCTECIHCHQRSNQLEKGGRLIVQENGYVLPIFDFTGKES